jgi:hypothetical protein
MEINQDLAAKQNFAAYLAKAFPSFATPAERLENFKHVQPETRAALERAYAVRADFGLWDECDAIANAIIVLTAAQNAVTAAINQDAETGDGDIHAAAVARVEAIIGLLEAVIHETIVPSGGTSIDRATMIRLATAMADVVKQLSDVAAVELSEEQ